MTSDSTQPTSMPPMSMMARSLGWVRTSPLLHAVVIAVLALAVLVASIAGIASRRNVERLPAAERAELVRSTTAMMTAQASALLRLTALPLGWAFRSALLTDDPTSIETYLRRMVKEPHVTGIVLVGADGKISHASNQKAPGSGRPRGVPRGGSRWPESHIHRRRARGADRRAGYGLRPPAGDSALNDSVPAEEP